MKNKISYAARILVLLVTVSLGAQAQTASTIIPKTVSRRDTARQTDLIDIGKSLFHIRPKVIRTEGDKKIYFSFLPISSAVPGGNGRALVTSTSAGIYLGPRKTTNLSSASFAPYWNFGSRFGLPLRTSIWLPENTWTIQGDVRFLRYPQDTWGLGSTRGEDDKSLVNYNYVRFYQSALKKIEPYLFAGFGYNLDYHSGIHSDEENIDLPTFTKYAYGTNGSSVSSGITFNLLYDTRNNSINPIMPGAYANIVYRVNPKFLGSNDNSSSVYADFRKYVRLNPEKRIQQNTLAFWTYVWSAVGNKTPYLDLPSLGWDPYNRSGRGFEQNRYRGRTLVYLEAEYRRDITANGLLGFVVFTNVNTVSGSGSLLTSYHPAAGTGLRVKFNKGSGTNIAVDYGISKGFSSITLGLGEAF
ncbi:BamA/TamA family outer membrane protein [Pedobacter duraquae]|uniref:Surface antigen-like protein n=1 Tax=Pedobacter duraquae TaxID=425511 RepID=A0A4R6ICE8_9SPHI|nr:BamA/TamA family outer membrane protein [Pedobacter duraquae]TDO19306.1 surface antigen-like protein [Pedobacter duraquae]